MYDAPALAQQLRNLAKEGKLEDWPIILCTTDDLFLQMYDKSTNDDLFDRIFYKENWSPSVCKRDLLEFESLAIGYDRIKAAIRDNLGIAGLLNSDSKAIITQVADKLPEAKTVHSIAAFLLKQLVIKPGLLIDEDILAIRLGVDAQKSDWEALKATFDSFRYKGVFSDGWSRWWIGDIMKWWRQISEGGSLRNSKAEDKVKLLQQVTKITNITPIAIPDHHSQSSFWYKCNITKTPLNSDDGILIKGQDKNFDWQDKEYISMYHIWTAASKKKEDEILNKVSSTDADKIKDIFGLKRKSI
ncbi:hypothetical protein [uncultured Dysgonomonas sp.]|uniref:hypothetical protein n=1 Tax=uncultured Dysgonomonas sp. TaxID=206096 RepID=UPI0026112FA9|nr:hypothetical protein [uncultured Dysgonomonas sp.]